MNWLAHLHLSEPCIHFQLGNLLADTMKGETWDGILPNTKRGFASHIAIDAFTDSHPTFKRSQTRLGPSGHLRGVVIDLAYDHFLSKHWHAYSDLSLPLFLRGFRETAPPSMERYPAKATRFVNGIIRSKRLESYAKLEGIQDAMERIDERLSARVLRKERTSDYFKEIAKNYAQLETDFLQFYPELHHFASHNSTTPPTQL